MYKLDEQLIWLLQVAKGRVEGRATMIKQKSEKPWYIMNIIIIFKLYYETAIHRDRIRNFWDRLQKYIFLILNSKIEASIPHYSTSRLGKV